MQCVYVERHGELKPTPVRFKDNDHLLRIINRIVVGGRPADRRIRADGRRAPARRQPGQRGHLPDRHRRRRGLDPEILQEAATTCSGWSSVGAMRPPIAEFLHGAVQVARLHRDLRRHRLGQDDPAQRPFGVIDDKERLITIEDAAELQLQQPHVGAHGDPAAQHRGQGRDPPARAGQERAAHAARPRDPGRVPWRGSLRHAAGHEHRS